MLVFLFCLVFYLNNSVFNLVHSISESEIRAQLTGAVNASVYKQLSENYDAYSNLVKIEKKSDGSIASLETNNSRLLNARATLVSSLLQNFKSTEVMQVKIPLGNLSGINILSGFGPQLKINSILTKNFNAYFENSFTEVGINQSLYQINFTVTYEIDLLIPSSKDNIKITQTFPVMSTVIVGEVPDAYTEITRLTDDINESDIDDLYDFGATIE